jgi:hypothetical protein
MKSKQYNKQILIGAILVFGIHFSLFSTGMFHLTLKSILAIDGFLFILYFLGTLIISPGLDKAPDNFVNRFLMLTTIQLMAVMFSVMLFVIMKIYNLKAVSYHLLAVFLCLMAIQSVLLIKRINQD